MKRTLELYYRRRDGSRLVLGESFVKLLVEAKTRKVKGEPVSIVRLSKGVYEINLLLRLLRLTPKYEPLGIKLLRSHSTDGYKKSPAIRISYERNYFILLSGAAVRTWDTLPREIKHEIPDKALPAVKIKMVEAKPLK